MANPIYAIGDIHGQADALDSALGLIEQDGGADARIVFLGDYVDRGPDSAAVIERLSSGVANGRNWVCLIGNHDRMFSMFLEEYPRNDARLLVGYHWLHEKLGGIETLQSYGVDLVDGDRTFQVHARARTAVPESHRKFLEQLQYMHIENGLLFVHAGIRPVVPIEDQEPEDLVWIRDEFLSDRTQHPYLIVHGHTPVPEACHYGNRVNLDSGAGFGRALTAAVFEDGQCWKLTEGGRVLLEPIDD